MKYLGLVLAVVLTAVSSVWAKKPVKEPGIAADITSPVQLEDAFNAVHELFLPPLPGDTVYIHSGKQIYFVDWNSGEWPEELLSQAVGELKTLGGLMYPEYTFYVVLDYNRDLVIYNEEGAAVFRRTVDYDPYFWALNYFGLSDASELTLAQQQLYHAAKFGVEIHVVPVSFAESYLEEEAVISEQEAMAELELAMAPMMMSLPAVVTNLQMVINQATNSMVELEIGWPTGYSTRLEMFTTTNLVTRGWELAYTNIVTTGSTNLVWLDMATSNLTTRFYSLTDADQDLDFDGLIDGREWYLYDTDYNLWDTDGDGFGDGTEILYGFDPLDAASGLGDVDGDGINDLTEAMLGGDPHAVGQSSDTNNATSLTVYRPSL